VSLAERLCFYLGLRDLSTDPEIKHVDLGKPILDFVCLHQCGEVWVLTDGEYHEDGASPEASPMVRIVKVVENTLVEAAQSSYRPELLESLNSNCTETDDANTIDLYSALTVLPKNLAVEHWPCSEGNVTADSESNTAPSTAEKQLSKKELGRLKSKQAVLARAAAGPQTGSEEEEREAKKTKNGMEGLQ